MGESTNKPVRQARTTVNSKGNAASNNDNVVQLNNAASHSNNNTTGDGNDKAGGLEGIEVKGKGIPGLAALKIPDNSGKKPPKAEDKAKTAKPAPGKKLDREQATVMLQTLLTVVFDICANRMGEHWRLKPAEARNLAEPIAAILERHDLLKITGEYGEYIALIVAIGSIVVPKFMMHSQVRKLKGGKANVPVQHIPANTGHTAGGSPANPDAGTHVDRDRAAQQPDTSYRPSDVKRALAIYG